MAVEARRRSAAKLFLFSYVSNTGSDSHDCSSPARACASFMVALAATAAYGEIDCVNAGPYGPASITQSVTIDCAGGASLAFGNFSDGPTLGSIDINGAGIVVRLRNLSLNNDGGGYRAIDAQNMAALYVENCVITNNTCNTSQYYVGIHFAPAVGTSRLFGTNSIISNNGNSNTNLIGGIYIVPAAGASARVSIDHSQITGNYFGIVGDGRSGGTIRGIISDSVVSGNSAHGVTAISSGSSVVFVADQTKVGGNLAGLFASGSNAGILARNTTVFDNTIGLDAVNGGTLFTYGNNSVSGNTANGAFTGTAALK